MQYVKAVDQSVGRAVGEAIGQPVGQEALGEKLLVFNGGKI